MYSFIKLARAVRIYLFHSRAQFSSTDGNSRIVDSQRILYWAFACRRVATIEHTFQLLHSVAFDQRWYANVISATSLSSTFRIGGLTIDTVFLAAHGRRVPRAIISPSRTISPLDATFLFPFDSTSPRLIVPRRSGHARFVRTQENTNLIDPVYSCG